MRRIIKHRLPSTLIQYAICVCVVFVSVGCRSIAGESDGHLDTGQLALADNIEERLTKIALDETLYRKEFRDGEVIMVLLRLVRNGARRLASENDGRGAYEHQIMTAERNLRQLIARIGKRLSATDRVEAVRLLGWIRENICPLYPFC